MARFNEGSNEYGGTCPPLRFQSFPPRYQRSNCNTLCCDWLASASAETAID
jgi:hypothetical protein